MVEVPAEPQAPSEKVRPDVLLILSALSQVTVHFYTSKAPNKCILSTK